MPQPRDETSNAILEAAGDLLAKEGAEALTVRRIAAQAGCSTMGLYSRFGGKDGVVEQLFMEGFQQLCAAMDEVRMADPETLDLRPCSRNYRQWALDNATQYLVMFGGAVPGYEPSSDAKAVSHACFEQLVAQVARMQSAGVMRSSPPAESIAEVIWATMHGHVMLELVGMQATQQDPAERYELVIDQMERGWAPEH
ncbi:MAG: TetR/AcrR family transcriptional regulator [Acidimicrobiia bacterium]|nr:TetR/AcrR family transcriptional regulator [Acidimicrobiia bacterium]